MTTLAVLAGGEGTRMGGPKDLLRDSGRPVLEALLARVKWKGPTMVVAPHGGRLPVGHEVFDRVVSDSVGGQGPLRGILTALFAAETEGVVFVSVDMPGVSGEQVEWIERSLREKPSALGVMVSREEQGHKKVEPFPSGFRVSAANILKVRLESGKLALHRISEQPGVEVVRAPREWGPDVWRNVNEPGDLPRGWSRGGDIQEGIRQ